MYMVHDLALNIISSQPWSKKQHCERVPSILTHIYVVFKKVNAFLVSRNGLESWKRVSGRRADGVNLQDRLRLHQGDVLKVVWS